NPFGELLLRVQIVETLGGALAADVPGLRVAPVHADVEERRRQRLHRQRDVLPLRPRSVDDDVRHPVLLEEAERLLALLVLVPAPVPELDEHLVVADLLAGPGEIVVRGLLGHDVRRELEQDAAELSGDAQRLERSEETAEDLAAELARGAVDPATLVLRAPVAQI